METECDNTVDKRSYRRFFILRAHLQRVLKSDIVPEILELCGPDCQNGR